MNNMQQMLDKIKKLKEVAESDPGHNVQTRRVKLGHIRQAKEKLELLYMEYRRQIQSNCLFIVATGENASKFAEKASSDFQCFSFNADIFYESILSEVPPRVYMDQMASRSFFEHLANRFEERAMEIDIVGYPPLYFDAVYKKKINSKEEALEMTKRAINDKIGSEVVGLDAIEQASKKAVNEGFEGKIIPIVLFSEDETLIKEMLQGLPRINRNVFLVSAGKKVQEDLQTKSINSMVKVTEESIKKTLLKVKENLI